MALSGLSHMYLAPPSRSTWQTALPLVLLVRDRTTAKTDIRIHSWKCTSWAPISRGGFSFSSNAEGTVTERQHGKRVKITRSSQAFPATEVELARACTYCAPFRLVESNDRSQPLVDADNESRSAGDWFDKFVLLLASSSWTSSLPLSRSDFFPSCPDLLLPVYDVKLTKGGEERKIERRE